MANDQLIELEQLCTRRSLRRVSTNTLREKMIPEMERVRTAYANDGQFALSGRVQKLIQTVENELKRRPKR